MSGWRLPADESVGVHNAALRSRVGKIAGNANWRLALMKKENRSKGWVCFLFIFFGACVSRASFNLIAATLISRESLYPPLNVECVSLFEHRLVKPSFNCSISQ